MKLRINGNSIRLRLLRSDVKTFAETGRAEAAVHFTADDNASLIYALEHAPDVANVTVHYKPSEVIVVLPTKLATAWAQTEQVGIYSSVELGLHGSLEIVVEKDFACLDLSDAHNHDTFPNPQQDTTC